MTSRKYLSIPILIAPLVWGAQNSTPAANSMDGEVLYQNHCARCHGRDAKGGQASTKGPTVQGPDLTRYAARHGGKFSLAEMRKIISGDQKLAGSHGTKVMPVWGKIFSEVTRDQDLGQVRIDNVARYLQKLQVK
jgi:mono/diheme cytochrome c family protein